MIYPEKRGKNIEFFTVLGLDGKEVLLSGLFLLWLSIFTEGVPSPTPNPPKKQAVSTSVQQLTQIH